MSPTSAGTVFGAVDNEEMKLQQNAKEKLSEVPNKLTIISVSVFIFHSDFMSALHFEPSERESDQRLSENSTKEIII